MARLKGISPLIAVIMLIAFTLIIAGILAGWATRFAESHRQRLEICSNARVLIQSGTWTKTSGHNGTLRLVIYNYGREDLSFLTLLTYKNTTRHPAGTVVISPTYNVSAGNIKTFTVINVSDDLQEATVQSEQCPGAQDFLRYIDIKGLGY